MREENSSILAGGGSVRNAIFRQPFEAARQAYPSTLRRRCRAGLFVPHNDGDAPSRPHPGLEMRWQAGNHRLRVRQHARAPQHPEIDHRGPPNEHFDMARCQLLARLLRGTNDPTVDDRPSAADHGRNGENGRTRLLFHEAGRIARAVVPTLVNGAHAIVAFLVYVGGLGADFYLGSVHKWLLGPAGVGFLVVHPD